MTYTAKVANCSETRTKHSTQSELHVELLSIKPGCTYNRQNLKVNIVINNTAVCLLALNKIIMWF
jgi:hypothetical protein